MIAVDPALLAFMNSATSAIRVDLLTLTLASGTVLRYTSADQAVTLPGGPTFAAGPLIERSRISSYAGLQVDELQFTLMPRDVDLADGVPLMRLAQLGGLRGCNVLLQWAYYDTALAYQGVMTKFSGQGSPIGYEAGAIELLARSELERLLIMMPRDVYQATCLNTLYDAGCGVARASYAVTGTVSAVPAGERSFFSSALAFASGYHDQGVVRFTSGPNTGVRRTVRASFSGTFNFALPFPFAIGIGDAFEASPGCDRTQAACSGKFGNLVRFRGQPYIPAPEVTT